jgi:para-aminobenzoate synthetase component 1
MKLIFVWNFMLKIIIDPLDKFLKLNEISQPPFAVFLKQPPILLSASPSGT